MHTTSLPIKAVIFDCDGTLIDNEGAHFFAWQKVVLNRNHFFSFDDFVLCMGNANPAVAKIFAAKLNAPSIEELLTEQRGYYLEYIKRGVKPITPTVNFVLQLAAEKKRLGIKLAVASAGKKEEILHSLKQVGLDQLFDAIVSGQDDLQGFSDAEGVNKPKPYIYLHTAKLLGVEPSACVVIEDSLPGLQAAVSAGCFSISVPTSSTKIQDHSIADLHLSSFEGISIDHFFSVVGYKILEQAKREEPTIIFLNGTSSAGKTSLVHSLQRQLNKPFLHIGIDHFLFMLPERYRMDGEESHLGYCFKKGDEGISITNGVYANKLHAVQSKTIENLLSENFNLIIDEVLYADEDFHAYLQLLQHKRVFFVSVKPPVEIAEQRELLRGERMLGLARGLYDKVYQNKKVDIEIDNSDMSSEEAAKVIIEYMQKNPEPQAFNQNNLQATIESLFCKVPKMVAKV